MWRRDLFVLAGSFVLALILISNSDFQSRLIDQPSGTIAGSFLAGFFFVSLFTLAPAGVALTELFRHAAEPLWLTVGLAALGSTTADWLIFRFVRNHLTEAILKVFRRSWRRRLFWFWRLNIFRWLLPFVGALVVASPLPDEIGLTLMGFAKLPTRIFLPLAFVLNALGLLLFALAARAF